MRLNFEQKTAVEHSGGVLLQAGAGSGKTFVLVEHVHFLINEFKKGHIRLNDDDYSRSLHRYLSGVVVLSFTKKAAGELFLRLNKRFDDDPITKKNLPAMCVSTIDGFCLRLLSQGYFFEHRPEDAVLTDIEVQYYMEKLFCKWVNKQEQSDHLDILRANQSSVVNILYSIFNSPSLRRSWRKFNLENSIDDLSSTLEKLWKVFGWNNFWDDDLDLAQYSNFSDKRWFTYVSEFQKLAQKGMIKTTKQIDEYLLFFEESDRAMAPRKSQQGLKKIISFMGKIREFNSFLKNNIESIRAFEENREIFISNVKLLKELFDFVEKSYEEIPGMSFSDREYHLLSNLENSESIAKLKKDFHTFIIDEFQDVSHFQYDIFKKITGGDLSKLFCVGDVKQAIYGFRGGEIAVFKECEKSMKKVFKLRNNYRSAQTIIDFVNHLSSFLWKQNIEEEFDFQKYPQSKKNIEGKIFKIKTILENIDNSTERNKKFGNKQKELWEAYVIFNHIKYLQKEYPKENICVIYKKLSPSDFLLPLMLKENFTFTMQVKVSMNEDPLLTIFRILIEVHTCNNEKFFEDVKRKGIVQLSAIYQYLGLKSNYISNCIDEFILDVSTLGLDKSFLKYLLQTGLSNSNYSNNMKSIHSLCRISDGNLEKILLILQNHKTEKYSLDFRRGENPERLLIMTAHSAKGLEFDHVILGGIHTNGNYVANRSQIGKRPGSFQWKCSTQQRKFFTSPDYLLEKELEKIKDRDESKRLLYVACSRAKKSLSWMEIPENQNYIKKKIHHWIDYLLLFQEKKQGEVEITSLNGKLSKNSEQENLQIPPVFHLDSLGIMGVDREKLERVGEVAHVSVTGLTSLVECPRKFYLQNICKIKKEDMMDLNLWQESSRGKSSMERGTMIHQEINQCLLGDWKVSENLKQSNDIEAVKWALSELEPFRHTHQILSEKKLNFSLFGHLLTGTADLIIKGENNILWDFKTGEISERNKQSYWFQIYIYAYACFMLGIWKKSSHVVLALVYVDKRKLLKEKKGFDEISRDIQNHWKKLSQLWLINKDHCPYCCYDGLCNPS